MRSISDPGLHSASLSPQSLSSGGDSGVDSYCDPMSDFPSITISLCGGLTDNREITKGKISHSNATRLHTPCFKRSNREHETCVCMCVLTEQFHEKMISYQQFAENPSIIDDPNLVVKIGSK